MKIAFLGDSITEGAGASAPEKRYVSRVGEKLGVNVLNYGISGTRIAKQKKLSVVHAWDMYFLSRFDFIEKDSDYLFVFGGTNDYGHGDAKMGKSGDNTDDTFIGAASRLADKCKSEFKDKLCFILPLKRYEYKASKHDGYVLEDYVDALREILTERGIDYIDLFSDGIPEPLTDKGDKYTSDGLHPNDFGHEFVADKIVEYLKAKKIVK